MNPKPTRVTLKRERPFPKAVSAWPVQIASVAITHRDGRRAAWAISASVNADSRCGKVGEPRLQIYTLTGPERITRVAGHFR